MIKNSICTATMPNMSFGVSQKQLIKVLKEQGCEFYREGKGGHAIWRSPNGAQAPIPEHGKELGTNLVHNIFKELNIPNPFRPISKAKVPVYA